MDSAPAKKAKRGKAFINDWEVLADASLTLNSEDGKGSDGQQEIKVRFTRVYIE